MKYVYFTKHTIKCMCADKLIVFNDTWPNDLFCEYFDVNNKQAISHGNFAYWSTGNVAVEYDNITKYITLKRFEPELGFDDSDDSSGKNEKPIVC